MPAEALILSAKAGRGVDEELGQLIRQLPPVALAFSGGVDSAYLLYALRASEHPFRAYYVASEFQPAFELKDAECLASELDVPLTVIRLSNLGNNKIAENGPQRCYYCKKQIFSHIAERALADGFNLLLDGTNADDQVDDRPGMRALTELGVRSPLREANLSKARIRELSRAAGLFTWDKPAYACLATRIAEGTAIDAASLARVEEAENALSAMGFKDFRCRKLGEAAKLEVNEHDLPLLIQKREQVLAVLRPYFEQVYLDLKLRN
ncbi:MAG: ATP-dependent sacrificial sulfur transferase LarE [Eubacteriales bacterium]|nr:ATP-dependent sacrificial sulfur transferase LarE [Eubacteriales bacterium]